MSIAIIIPCYNEDQVIHSVIQQVLSITPLVIVVDDGSKDNSWDVIKKSGVYALQHSVNLGQGASLQTGIAYALQKGAEYIVTFDADGQHNYADILDMIEYLKQHQADILLGSRFLNLQEKSNVPFTRKIILKVATIYTNLTTGLHLSDVHNGFRVMSNRFAKNLNIRQNRMAHASEILEYISYTKAKYIEYPTKVNYTNYSINKGQTNLQAANILVELFLGKLYK